MSIGSEAQTPAPATADEIIDIHPSDSLQKNYPPQILLNIITLPNLKLTPGLTCFLL